MDGHVREGCFKIIGYPDWFKTKNKASTQPVKGYKNTKMMTTVERGSTGEGNPLDYPNTRSRINELTSILSSLK